MSTGRPARSTPASSSTTAPFHASHHATLPILSSPNPVAALTASTIFGLLRCPSSSVNSDAAGKSSEIALSDGLRTARRVPEWSVRKFREVAAGW